MTLPADIVRRFLAVPDTKLDLGTVTGLGVASAVRMRSAVGWRPNCGWALPCSGLRQRPAAEPEHQSRTLLPGRRYDVAGPCVHGHGPADPGIDDCDHAQCQERGGRNGAPRVAGFLGFSELGLMPWHCLPFRLFLAAGVSDGVDDEVKVDLVEAGDGMTQDDG